MLLAPALPSSIAQKGLDTVDDALRLRCGWLSSSSEWPPLGWPIAENSHRTESRLRLSGVAPDCHCHCMREAKLCRCRCWPLGGTAPLWSALSSGCLTRHTLAFCKPTRDLGDEH